MSGLSMRIRLSGDIGNENLDRLTFEHLYNVESLEKLDNIIKLISSIYLDLCELEDLEGLDSFGEGQLIICEQIMSLLNNDKNDL